MITTVKDICQKNCALIDEDEQDKLYGIYYMWSIKQKQILDEPKDEEDPTKDLVKIVSSRLEKLKNVLLDGKEELNELLTEVLAETNTTEVMKRKSMAAFQEEFSDDSGANDEQANNQYFAEDIKAMVDQDGDQSVSESSIDESNENDGKLIYLNVYLGP